MKKYYLQLSVTIITIFILQGCVKDHLTTTYTFFSPVYKSKAEVLQNIKSAAPQPLQNTGKLFVLGNYIFVNELNKGVHVIDNSNPASPKNISFISIPGNIDIAVKNNTLYADLFTDMVTLDISNTTNISLKKMTANVFPERDYQYGFAYDSTRYIVDWTRGETTSKRELGENTQREPVLWLTASQLSSDMAASSAKIGVSGSMARFTIVNNYLYTVGRSNLTAFNISSSINPVSENVKSLGWNIETIYPFKDKLFIGSQTGMFIYSISNPKDPSFVGSFSHACFKDPVIADDQYAYVTLRAATDGASCLGVAAQRNELDIVNISDLMQPSLVKIYDMTEPQGLSKDGDHLFICDGKGGLKVYDASNVQDLKLIKTIGNIKPFDIICQAGNAIVVAEEGIYQFDYSNINSIKMVSKISIDKK
ncbi:MAG: hypothetical protein ABIN67_13030 [Ferruginibacter sp.]